MKRVDGLRSHERGAQGHFRLAPEIRIESGLERQRQWEAPSSIDGEEVLKFGQANYDGGTRFKSTWKPGFLYLTENRAIFFQGANRVVDIPVIELESITIVTRDWIPGRTAEQLCLIQRSRNVKRTFHMRMTKPEEWKDGLEETLKEAQSKEKEVQSLFQGGEAADAIVVSKKAGLSIEYADYLCKRMRRMGDLEIVSPSTPGGYPVYRIPVKEQEEEEIG